MLKLVAPGSDAYGSEKYAAELQKVLDRFRQRLLATTAGHESELREFLHPEATHSNRAAAEHEVRNVFGLRITRRTYTEGSTRGRNSLTAELADYFSSLGKVTTAEFEITSLEEIPSSSQELETAVRYSLVGTRIDHFCEERIGQCRLRWLKNNSGDWLISEWAFENESTGTSRARMFADITEPALGGTQSYRKQLAHSVDYWRTVLDAASGIDVYGNSGIAAGDFDGDGCDDFYVCQPSGLPNRLYRNRGDATFEDVTERAGVGVLDATACAIFADFQNNGLQDLLVVTASGPLLFLNRGDGTFALKPDSFSFAKPPQGTFTHAAVADYDRDGRLDVYFCVYSYYLGLDQYHYPSPYFDARNGPPNFLFHNEGRGTFVDRTAAAGLHTENDRYSFACAWGDITGNAGPDLYVANDFGRSNLYRNNGDGTFTAISAQAGVDVPGAGMSACWCDFQNTGRQDLYVSNMWSAAGHRVSSEQKFHGNDAAEIRGFYRGHARGNSLYRNRGEGKFEEVAKASAAAMGRWAWCSDSWDFDHDGYSDLYIANGYISGTAPPELSSFFWRQVVGNSPPDTVPSASYEQGWNAINELIRSDHTWNGYERNTLYLNNRDGSFSEVSGISGLDFLDDSRAFALTDLDGDGRLEVVLKNRTAPQVRVLRNVMNEVGEAACIRLRGVKSNRDAIGAAVTVICGDLRQTKYLQAGSGFLSQHSKELFFGLGKVKEPVSLTVRWPSGLRQTFDQIPFGHRITIVEGEVQFSAHPFAPRKAASPNGDAALQQTEGLPDKVETWLLDPLLAPDFSLPDLSGEAQRLTSLRGRPILLTLWAETPACLEQLLSVQRAMTDLTANGVRAIAVNLNAAADSAGARAFAAANHITLPILLGTLEVAGVYNILYRYLFDRRRDLPLPCTLLLDAAGMIVKVYQGTFDAALFASDAAEIPRTDATRVAQGLPFPGTLHNGRFARNDFTIGVAFFQHGLLDQAAESFRQVIAAKPDDAEAHYNLGTLYLRKNDLIQAQQYLEQTVKLRPAYPEAWNNLGMIAGQQNRADDAIRNFQTSLDLRPNYVTALLNLGNMYRRQGNFAESARLLNRAVELEPENAEANYSLGMLYARQNDISQATELLRKAVAFRPDYPDAVNNLGVLLVRQGKNSEAEQQFAACIRVAPSFDQAYLNLARLYMLLQEKEKARETLQALLKLQPGHKLAQQALEMLN